MGNVTVMPLWRHYDLIVTSSWCHFDIMTLKDVTYSAFCKSFHIQFYHTLHRLTTVCVDEMWCVIHFCTYVLPDPAPPDNSVHWWDVMCFYIFVPGDLDLWPMTLTIESDLGMAKIKQHTKNEGPRWSGSKVIAKRDIHPYIHTSIHTVPVTIAKSVFQTEG